MTHDIKTTNGDVVRYFAVSPKPNLAYEISRNGKKIVREIPLCKTRDSKLVRLWHVLWQEHFATAHPERDAEKEIHKIAEACTAVG